MIKFTVELEDRTLTVMADRADIEGKTLNLYNIRTEPTLGGQFNVVHRDIVGSFNDYRNFYVDGDK